MLDSHHKYNKVVNMSPLLDVINKESSTLFLHDDATRTTIVVCITHNTIIWKGGLNWGSFFIGLLNAHASFMVVACICSRELFKNLFTIVSKLIFVTKIRFEFGQYMAQEREVPFQSTTLLNNLMSMYTYFLPYKIGTNVHQYSRK